MKIEVNMKAVCIATCLSIAAVAIAAVADTVGMDERLARVKAVGDGVCRIDGVAVVTRADPEGEDPLAQWAAMQKDDSKAEGAFVRVDFSIVPEAGSDIRCRAELPLPGKWDGRMWGLGNGGYAGRLPSIAPYVAAGTAAVTTDLGTSAITDGGKSNSKIWPKNVQRDYNWRATHLMTVYGKGIVKAFYGRQCDKAYFCGGSCGGRQAMCEAIRFPGDYDGIISVLPAIFGGRRMTRTASRSSRRMKCGQCPTPPWRSGRNPTLRRTPEGSLRTPDSPRPTSTAFSRLPRRNARPSRSATRLRG